MTAYTDFLASKARRHGDAGHRIDPDTLHPSLFPHQRAVTAWAVVGERDDAIISHIDKNAAFERSLTVADWRNLVPRRVSVGIDWCITHHGISWSRKGREDREVCVLRPLFYEEAGDG
jgi:hypothetical protein